MRSKTIGALFRYCSTAYYDIPNTGQDPINVKLMSSELSTRDTRTSWCRANEMLSIIFLKTMKFKIIAKIPGKIGGKRMMQGKSGDTVNRGPVNWRMTVVINLSHYF